MNESKVCNLLLLVDCWVEGPPISLFLGAQQTLGSPLTAGWTWLQLPTIFGMLMLTLS